MLRKTVTLFLVCVLISGLCAGCTSTKSAETTVATTAAIPSDSNTVAVEAPTVEQTAAEGFETLGDLWAIRGIFYKNNLIDVHDNDALQDLYDSNYLTFSEDGTFHYMFFNIQRGKYTMQKNGTFLLKTESVFTYDITADGLVEKEVENPTLTTYLLTLLDDDTFLLNEYDPMIGKAAADSTDYIFVRNGEDSNYLMANKTPINNSSDGSGTSETQNTPKETEKPTVSTGFVSSGMRNALQQAKNYLAVMPFSYSGLVEQLEFEGYSHSEAVYGAENCGADWYEQAAKKAEQYLEIMSFSRSGLIDQLEFDGFTHEEAVYGVDKVY